MLCGHLPAGDATGAQADSRVRDVRGVGANLTNRLIANQARCTMPTAPTAQLKVTSPAAWPVQEAQKAGCPPLGSPL